MMAAAHTRGLPNFGYVTPEARYWFDHGRTILYTALFRAANRGLVKWRPRDPQLLPLLRNEHKLLDRTDAVLILNHLTEAIAHYEEEFNRIHGRRNVHAAAAVPFAPVLRVARSENVPSLPAAGPGHLLQPDGNARRVEAGDNGAILPGMRVTPRHGPQQGSHILQPAIQGAAPGSSAGNAISVDDGEENVQYASGEKRAGKRPIRNDSGYGSNGSTPGDAIVLNDDSEIEHPRPASNPATLPVTDQSDATTPSPPHSSTPNTGSETAPKRRRNGPATFPGLQDRFPQGDQPTGKSIADHLAMAVPGAKKYAWQTLTGAGIFNPSKVEKPGRKEKSKAPTKAVQHSVRKALQDDAAASSSASSPAPCGPVENDLSELAVFEPVDVAMTDVEPEYEEGSLEAMLQAALEQDDEPVDDDADSGELIIDDPEEIWQERVRRLQAAQEYEEDSLEANLMRDLNS